MPAPKRALSSAITSSRIVFISCVSRVSLPFAPACTAFLYSAGVSVGARAGWSGRTGLASTDLDCALHRSARSMSSRRLRTSASLPPSAKVTFRPSPGRVNRIVAPGSSDGTPLGARDRMRSFMRFAIAISRSRSAAVRKLTSPEIMDCASAMPRSKVTWREVASAAFFSLRVCA